MDIRQFRSELAQEFEAAGFERKKIKGTKGPIWVLPGREVQRAFWEHAQRRSWGFVLSGSLMLDVPEFRSWLTRQFPSEQHGVLRASILNRHIANEPDMFFAAEDEPPPYRAWVKSIKGGSPRCPTQSKG